MHVQIRLDKVDQVLLCPPSLAHWKRWQCFHCALHTLNSYELTLKHKMLPYEKITLLAHAAEHCLYWLAEPLHDTKTFQAFGEDARDWSLGNYLFI